MGLYSKYIYNMKYRSGVSGPVLAWCSNYSFECLIDRSVLIENPVTYYIFNSAFPVQCISIKRQHVINRQ